MEREGEQHRLRRLRLGLPAPFSPHKGLFFLLSTPRPICRGFFLYSWGMVETTDINEAAYLYTLGIAPQSIRRTDHVKAIFYYRPTKDVRGYLLHYRTGMAEGCLSHFMYTRNALKYMIASNPIEKLSEAPVYGDGYWYIVNKTILHAVYGKDVTHYNRYKEGNFYKTKQEAQEALGI